MKGANKLLINQATMIEAMQRYMESLFSSANDYPEVTYVASMDTNDEVFELGLTSNSDAN